VFLLCGKIQRRKKNGRKSGKSYTPLCENSRISKSVEKLHTPRENGVVKPFFKGSNESRLWRLALLPFLVLGLFIFEKAAGGEPATFSKRKLFMMI